MNIYELVNKYVTAGYSEDDAIPKVAQDIVLLKIGNSKYSKNITVKGGVVMHNISKDMRRATRDMDIYFIKYSLEDKSILNFIKESGQITSHQAEALLKVKQRRARIILGEMVEMEILERQGSYKSTVYVLKDNCL